MRAIKQAARQPATHASPTLIRSSDTDDVPIVVALAEGTQVFTPIEIVGLQEDFENYLQGIDPQDRMVTCLHAGRVVGFAHFGPAAITQGTWYLFWIAVDKSCQGQGFGSDLLRRVESEIAHSGGRMVIIETSMLARYEPTRRFYLGQGYRQAGVIPDYYSEGDHKVVFCRKL